MKTYFQPYLIALVFWFMVALPASGQYKILEDKGAVRQVQQAIDSIYNLNFAAADPIIAELDRKLPDYPGILLLKAFYTNWKYQPIKEGHPSFELFETYLLKAIDKSLAMLAEDEDNIEATFFLLASHGFLAELYSENGQNLNALGEAKLAYKYIKIGFEHTAENPEFYFSSGIYNYYREKYPQENPFYKSFLWFFRSGDMEEGLRMLKKGAQLAIFTKAECLTYLFHINLRYENKPQTAIYYARQLVEKYPRNLVYVANFVENKIRMDQYDGLIAMISQLRTDKSAFYRYVGEVFYAIYLEKSVKNPELATAHYLKADKIGDIDHIREPHYDGMIYLGLGRIYRIVDKKTKANNT
ncbi:MAG: hypothetical protein HC819_16255 [Cyclobacteriaceae bacterium]|nr:hypothetical protein [Cyclobacteriaceae bacterium]